MSLSFYLNMEVIMKLQYCRDIPQHGELGNSPEVATDAETRVKRHCFKNIISEFLKSERPYAEVILDESEYAAPHGFYHSIRRFVDKHHINNISVIRRGSRIFFKRWYW